MGIGRKTGKKLLSGVLSFAMMVGMVSGVSFNTFADEVTKYPLWIGPTQVDSSNCDELSENKWAYNDSSKALTLSGFTGSGGPEGATIKYTGEEDGLTIILEGNNNKISDTNQTDAVPGIYSEKMDVTIKGSGSLSIETAADNAILVDGDFQFRIDDGAIVSAEAKDVAVKAGTIYVENGSLTAEGTGDSSCGTCSCPC